MSFHGTTNANEEKLELNLSFDKIASSFSQNANVGCSDDVLFPQISLLPNMSDEQTNDANLSQGFKDFKRLKFIEALSRFQRAVNQQQHHGSFVPHFVRGLCFFEVGDYTSALKDFNITCKTPVSQSRTDYEQALAYYNRSIIYKKLNGMERAMSDINTAIKLFPSEEFLSGRALLHRRFGCFEEARRDYLTIRKLKSKKADSSTGKEKEKGLKRQETMIVTSPTKATLKAARLKRIPSAKKHNRSSSSMDLKTKVYGQVHAALTCPPERRTKKQIEMLVKESAMMTAFVHFDSDQLATLWRFLEYKKYPSNARIFEEGDIADDYFLVWSGAVSARINKHHSILQHTANIASALAMENELKVNTMTAGETLGEAILSEDGVRKASCVTEEPSEIIILNRKHFNRTIHIFLSKTRKEKIEFLKRFDFLTDWDHQKLDLLAQICRQKVYHADNIIIKQGSAADSMYFIKTGIVSLRRKLNKFDVCIATLSAGEVFGETSLDKNDLAVFPYSVVCDTMTICYRLDRMQIDKDQWDSFTRTKLLSRHSYADDAALIKVYLNNMRLKKQSENFIKKIRGKGKYKGTV